MANALYNRFKQDVLKKVHNLGTDTIMVALVSGYTFSQSHQVWADVSSSEIANGNGYTTGGQQLTGNAVSIDGTNNRGVFSANNPSWSSSTITATGAIIYSASATGNPLIAYIDFGGAKSDSASIFTIQWDASGVLYFG
jgi:hypothetical protein